MKCDHPEVLTRNVPVRRIQTTDGEVLVATVFDLFAAPTADVDRRGFGGKHVAQSYDDNKCRTAPAWAEKITGVPRDQIITDRARVQRCDAERPTGRSMIIIGAADGPSGSTAT